jgi:cytosine/uracil/thiamine/allantoin permease
VVFLTPCIVLATIQKYVHNKTISFQYNVRGLGIHGSKLDVLIRTNTQIVNNGISTNFNQVYVNIILDTISVLLRLYLLLYILTFYV